MRRIILIFIVVSVVLILLKVEEFTATILSIGITWFIVWFINSVQDDAQQEINRKNPTMHKKSNFNSLPQKTEKQKQEEEYIRFENEMRTNFPYKSDLE